jgi:hypothetical protein
MQNIASNANYYLRGKDRFNELTSDQIESLRNTTNELFVLYGLDRVVKFVDYQPYENVLQMSTWYYCNNELLISNQFNDSDLFGSDSNLKFRAVHDFLHILLNQPFGYEGECKVYEVQKLAYSQDLHKVLYSEICLQAAYVDYYGNFPTQKIVY